MIYYRQCHFFAAAPHPAAVAPGRAGAAEAVNIPSGDSERATGVLRASLPLPRKSAPFAPVPSHR
jgi:hypothetical protein